MAKKLNTTVHVDSIPYGPGVDIPDDVAEKITAPGVWAEPGEVDDTDPVGFVSDQPTANPGVGELIRPAASAAKTAWVEFAVEQGLDREAAEKLTRDQLVERFPADADTR